MSTPPGATHLAEAAFAAYRELADAYDVVVCEGAGSPAEINLRAGDYVNMGLARGSGCRCVVVGDIDRGGVFASLYGTWRCSTRTTGRCCKSFVINKFRGDVACSSPGWTRSRSAPGCPFLGVLPVAARGVARRRGHPRGRRAGARRPPVASARDRLEVAVVRFPRMSNATDVDALAAEPGVEVLVTTDPACRRAADWSCCPDRVRPQAISAWLRERGLADVRRSPGGGRAAGARDLRRLPDARRTTIEDDVEGRVGRRAGPGPAAGPGRVRRGQGARPAGRIVARAPGRRRYEIHHGIARRSTPTVARGSRRAAVPGRLERRHGVGHDVARRLRERRLPPGLARRGRACAGSRWRPEPDAPGFAARRERMIDTLADALEEHVDIDVLLALTRHR